MLPVMTSGKHAVTIVFSSEKSKVGNNTGVGFVGPAFSKWNDSYLWSNGGHGVCANNFTGDMQFPGDDYVFKKGDRVTLEVDFGADTMSIYRNKGTSGEGKHVKQGIPFKEVYFAAGPWDNGTCTIQADGVRFTTARALPLAVPWFIRRVAIFPSALLRCSS